MNRESDIKELQLAITPLYGRIEGIISITIVFWVLSFALMIESEAKVIFSSTIAGGVMMLLLIRSVKAFPKYWFGEAEGGS